jgi:hypothetical protein
MLAMFKIVGDRIEALSPRRGPHDLARSPLR